VFSFFTPWFFIAFLMASIDDTKSGRIILFNKGKKILTKNGGKRVVLLIIALFALGFLYFSMHLLNIKNSWLDLLLIIFIALAAWYALFTNSYSFKKKKFKKAKQVLTKSGRKDIVKLLLFPVVLLILYLLSTFISYSCSFVIFLILVLFVVFYLSIGNRRKKLKNNFIKVYKNIKPSFKKK
jgi:protein-S-isoprenylcysteine O-methyltransferase Ste14